MTDDEMQRLGQIVADEVCRRASDEIKLICLRFLCVVIVFWIAKIAFLFLRDLRKEMQK